MLSRYLTIISILSLSLSHVSYAAESYISKYSGEEQRLIKSLSADDIKQLEQGKGWGLAKAAELNGMPGPVHILQMKDEISLSIEQENKIKDLFSNMRIRAVPLGIKLIQLEKNLNNSFVKKSIDKSSLLQQLSDIAEVKKQLRYVHLSTHLETPHILNQHQIHQYNRLRGYGKAGVLHKGMH